MTADYRVGRHLEAVKVMAFPHLFPTFIPHLWFNVGDKVGDRKQPLNATQKKTVDTMRDDPNVTHAKLMVTVGVGKTAIQNNVSFLRKNGFIERVGSKKNGYWRVL